MDALPGSPRYHKVQRYIHHPHIPHLLQLQHHLQLPLQTLHKPIHIIRRRLPTPNIHPIHQYEIRIPALIKRRTPRRVRHDARDTIRRPRRAFIGYIDAEDVRVEEVVDECHMLCLCEGPVDPVYRAGETAVGAVVGRFPNLSQYVGLAWWFHPICHAFVTQHLKLWKDIRHPCRVRAIIQKHHDPLPAVDHRAQCWPCRLWDGDGGRDECQLV